MPNSCCDLHIHSHYSDGRASPVEILQAAAEMGLKTVAITDHDNVNAAEEAQNVARRLGLDLIPAIECTAYWEREEKGAAPFEYDVDILGYWIDPFDTDFRAFTRAALLDVGSRVESCCQLLSAAGFPVTIEEVLDHNPRYPGAMPLTAVLLKKGHASNWYEARQLFNQYWPEVQPARFSIREVIETIHRAGGVTVLAHPVVLRSDDAFLSTGATRQLVDMGLDGLEVYHPVMNQAARRYFREAAEEFGLLVTGGSDEHGWPDGFPRLGSEPVTYPMTNSLRERANKLHSKP